MKFFKSRIFLYSISLALLLVVLRIIEYKYLVIDHAEDMYALLIAIFFTIMGIWAGIRLTSKKPVIIERKVPVLIENELFDAQAVPEKLKEFNISDREFEVLVLISKGFTNQQIADQLYISLSSVKTYTARLFSKLDVERRTQAVQKAKGMGLLH